MFLFNKNGYGRYLEFVERYKVAPYRKNEKLKNSKSYFTEFKRCKDAN